MKVRVRNFLSGHCAVCKKKMHPLAFQSGATNRLSHALPDYKHMRSNVIIQFAEKSSGLKRNNKYMTGIQWLNIHKDCNFIISIDK